MFKNLTMEALCCMFSVRQGGQGNAGERPEHPGVPRAKPGWHQAVRGIADTIPPQ